MGIPFLWSQLQAQFHTVTQSALFEGYEGTCHVFLFCLGWCSKQVNPSWHRCHMSTFVFCSQLLESSSQGFNLKRWMVLANETASHFSMDCLFIPSLRFSLYLWASLVAQRLKHLPGMQETWVWSLGQEDPLEKEMTTHSSTLAWEIPWAEEPGRLQSIGSQKSWTWLSDFCCCLITKSCQTLVTL